MDLLLILLITLSIWPAVAFFVLAVAHALAPSNRPIQITLRRLWDTMLRIQVVFEL